MADKERGMPKVQTKGDSPRYAAAGERVMELLLINIDPDPKQPRSAFEKEKLDRLKASIAKVGQIDPIKVVRSGKRWKIVDGERRYRACRSLRKATIRAIEWFPNNEAEHFELSVISNANRCDLLPIEEARAIRRLRHHGRSFQEIATIVGNSVGWVLQRDALNDLDPRVQAMMESPDETKRLRSSVAAMLRGLPLDQQYRIATRAMTEGLSISQVRHEVRKQAQYGGRKQGAHGRKPYDDFKVTFEMIRRFRRDVGLRIQLPPAELERLFKNRSSEDVRTMVGLIGGLAHEFSTLVAWLEVNFNRLQKATR